MQSLIAIPFHGDTITCIETEDGAFVAMRPICERLGLDWKSQHRKLTSDLERWSVVIMTTETAAGERESVCIPVSKVCGWLATISASKVRPELADMLRLYQIEADTVLDRHFRLRALDRQAEIDWLREKHAQALAHLFAARPIFGRIEHLRRSGLPYIRLKSLIGRSQAETDDLAEEMIRIGAFEREDWPYFEDWSQRRKPQPAQGELELTPVEQAAETLADAFAEA